MLQFHQNISCCTAKSPQVSDIRLTDYNRRVNHVPVNGIIFRVRYFYYIASAKGNFNQNEELLHVYYC